MPKLTEDEKFIMCVLAGCTTVAFVDEKGSVRQKTKHPCGVFYDGTKWIVVEAVNAP